MSSSIQKQKIKPTWDVKKMQEAATNMVSHKIASRLQCIENHPGKEIEEMEKHCAQMKAEVIKQYGVRTPMDLVKHLAEFEVNMFGAEASIEGNDQQATLINEKPTVWLDAKKQTHLSKDQEMKMQKHYRQWMDDLAQQFGFKAQVEIAHDGNSSKITFSK
jgi:hypothetical protein